MKILTTILIIILITALVLLGFIAGQIFITGSPDPENEPDKISEEDIDDIQTKPGEDPGTPIIEEDIEEELDLESIQSIEIYLDGNRDDGIFLGEAQYGLISKDAYDIYGEDFSETGFILALDNEEYDFVPGSEHYLYIYTYIPEYGWEYIRERVVIEGEKDVSSTIELHTDTIGDNSLIIGSDDPDVRVSGWSADFKTADSTGIDRIEIYLNGPAQFGRNLGTAEYGLERQDVADAFNNSSYLRSGYNFYFDPSILEPGSINTLYVYSFAKDGTYNYLTRDFLVKGEGQDLNTILSVTANLNNNEIAVSGWAINKKWIEEGKPRDLNKEYDTKKIIFTSDMTGDENIFSINMDGSGLTQLTDHAGMDSYPAVSPDGNKIAYTSDINGHWQLVIMDQDGSNKVQLTNTNVRSGFPSWSFDGRYIFYEVYKDGDWEIYRINSDGSSIKRITFNAEGDDWHPHCHPYKYEVLYESGIPGHEDIYIMDFEGNNIKKISDNPMRKRVPTISVDGEIILFAGYEGNNFYIYTMDKNGDNISKVPGIPDNSGHPDISPDNKYITFQALSNPGNDASEIYIINLDGTGLKKLTQTGGTNWDPVFMFSTSE